MGVETLTSIASEARRRLDYQSMKPEQVNVVVKILQGRDVFAILRKESLLRLFTFSV